MTGVEVQKLTTQKNDRTPLLWYRANVHPEEDVVQADVRNVGGPGNRGAHGLEVHSVGIWFIPGEPRVGQEDRDKISLEIVHLFKSVEKTQLAFFPNDLKLDEVSQIKKVRGSDECHGRTQRSCIGFCVTNNLVPRCLLLGAKSLPLQDGQGQPTSKDKEGKEK